MGTGHGEFEGRTRESMSLDHFLAKYLELTDAIGAAIDQADWDAVNRLLEERETWIEKEGQTFATNPPQSLTENQRRLLQNIRAQDEKNLIRLQGEWKDVQQQIRQSQVTRQALRGYMEEGLLRDGMHSTFFNRGV